MHQHNDYLFVPVPEGARSFEIDNTMGQKLLWKEGEYGESDEWIYEKLPPGPWQYICLASQAGEEDWGEIVSNEFRPDLDGGYGMEVVGFTNYEGHGVCDTAIDSGFSLLRSLDLKGEIAILKLVKS
jgi:hypothetical protein